jgi:hypothetical protein
MPLPAGLQKIWDFIRSQSTVWLTTTLLAIMTVFTQTIADRIKTGLNNADQRRKSFESISKDFSALLFNAENAIESYQLALDPAARGRIDPNNLKTTIDPYNTSITAIRSNQYSYKYELNAYGRYKWLIFRTDVSEQYDSLMVYVVRLDSAMHRINPVALKIAPLVGKKDSVYQLDHADSAVLKVVLPAANAALRETKAKADQFFNSL